MVVILYCCTHNTMPNDVIASHVSNAHFHVQSIDVLMIYMVQPTPDFRQLHIYKLYVTLSIFDCNILINERPGFYSLLI